jgi:G:T-mismatch repair DNA endonuclease (very short patch repair protein)
MNKPVENLLSQMSLKDLLTRQALFSLKRLSALALFSCKKNFKVVCSIAGCFYHEHGCRNDIHSPWSDFYRTCQGVQATV